MKKIVIIVVIIAAAVMGYLKFMGGETEAEIVVPEIGAPVVVE